MTNTESLWVTPLSSSLRLMWPWKSSPPLPPSALWGLPSVRTAVHPEIWARLLAANKMTLFAALQYFDMEGVVSLNARVQGIYPTPNLWFSRWTWLKWLLVFATRLLQTHKNFLYPPLSVLPRAKYNKLSPEIKSSPKAFLPVWQSMHGNMIQEGWEISEKMEYRLNPTFGWCTFPANDPRTGRGPLICPKTAKTIKQL